MINNSLHLKINSSEIFLNLVENHCRTAISLFGFIENEGFDTGKTIAKAVDYVIKKSFDIEETQCVEIIINRISKGIIVSIKDEGIPFSQSEIDEFDQTEVVIEPFSENLTISNLIDEIEFKNHGSRGKEFLLVKYMDKWRKVS